MASESKPEFVPRAMLIWKNPTVGALAGQSAEFFHCPVVPKSNTSQKRAKRHTHRRLRRSKSWRTTAYQTRLSTDDLEEESYSAISQSPFVSNRNKVRQRMRHKRTMLQTIQEKLPIAENADCKTKRSVEKKPSAMDSKPKGILKPHTKNHRVAAKLEQEAANIMLGVVSGLGNVDTEIKDRSNLGVNSTAFNTPSRTKQENSEESMCGLYTPCYCENCFDVELEWENKECIRDARRKRRTRNHHSSGSKATSRKCRIPANKAGNGQEAKSSPEATFLKPKSVEFDKGSCKWPTESSPSPSPLKPRPRLFDYPSLPPDKGSESLGSLEYSSDEGREDKESTADRNIRFSWPDWLLR